MKAFLILVVIAGIKTVSHMNEGGFLDALKKILRVTKYVIFKSARKSIK